MNFKYFIVLFFFCNEIEKLKAVTLSEAFLLFTEKLRDRMHLEQPGFGLPVLHPFTLDRMDLDLSEEEGGFSGYIANVIVENINTFFIYDMLMDTALNYAYNLTIPFLNVSLDYEINGEIGGFFPIFGSGKITLDIIKPHVHSIGSISYDDDIWGIPTMRNYFTLEKLNFEITGLTDSQVIEDFINDLINDAGAEIINELFPEFEDTVNEIVRQLQPQLMGDLTLTNFLFILAGECDNTFFPNITEQIRKEDSAMCF